MSNTGGSSLAVLVERPAALPSSNECPLRHLGKQVAAIDGEHGWYARSGAADGDADAAYRDIGETYGTVPGFFRLFSSDEVATAWDAFKLLQLKS